MSWIRSFWQVSSRIFLFICLFALVPYLSIFQLPDFSKFLAKEIVINIMPGEDVFAPIYSSENLSSIVDRILKQHDNSVTQQNIGAVAQEIIESYAPGLSAEFRQEAGWRVAQTVTNELGLADGGAAPAAAGEPANLALIAQRLISASNQAIAAANPPATYPNFLEYLFGSALRYWIAAISAGAAAIGLYLIYLYLVRSPQDEIRRLNLGQWVFWIGSILIVAVAIVFFLFFPNLGELWSRVSFFWVTIIILFLAMASYIFAYFISFYSVLSLPTVQRRYDFLALWRRVGLTFIVNPTGNAIHIRQIMKIIEEILNFIRKIVPEEV